MSSSSSSKWMCEECSTWNPTGTTICKNKLCAWDARDTVEIPEEGDVVSDFVDDPWRNDDIVYGDLGDVN